MQNQALRRLKDERDGAVRQTQQLQQELVYIMFFPNLFVSNLIN